MQNCITFGVSRTLESVLAKATQEFPAVLVTGPRQSGKTTLLQQTFGHTHRFVSLDEPDVRALALADPRLFLQQNTPPVVFDEIQYVPELLHCIKRDIEERDVRNMRDVGSLNDFQRFLQLLGARVAQRIKITDLARDIGVAVNTIKAWLSVLEATYQIVLLRPYHTNMGKRLVKAPKLYFLDPGLPRPTFRSQTKRDPHPAPGRWPARVYRAFPRPGA